MEKISQPEAAQAFDVLLATSGRPIRPMCEAPARRILGLDTSLRYREKRSGGGKTEAQPEGQEYEKITIESLLWMDVTEAFNNRGAST